MSFPATPRVIAIDCWPRRLGTLSSGRLSRARVLAALALIGSSACNDPVTPTAPPDAEVVWSHSGNAAVGQPYADDELVVFLTLDQTSVVALDALTGAPRWEQRLPPPPGLILRGTLTTNIVRFEDLVIVPRWDTYALDRATGAIRWVFSEPPESGSGTLNVGLADDRLIVPGATGTLYALDPRTGNLLWRAELGERPVRPAVLDGIIYVATRAPLDPASVPLVGSGRAAAVDAATGDVLWNVSLPELDLTLGAIGGTVGPLSPSEHAVLGAGITGRVFALDRATGTLLWESPGAGPYFAGLVVPGETVVTAGDAARVEGFDIGNGARVWTDAPGAPASHLITRGNDAALIVAGALTAYDASGQARWRYSGPVFTSSATYHNDRVYVGSTAGLHAVRRPE